MSVTIALNLLEPGRTYPLATIDERTTLPVDPEAETQELDLLLDAEQTRALHRCLALADEPHPDYSEFYGMTLTELRPQFRVEMDHFHAKYRLITNHVCYYAKGEGDERLTVVFGPLEGEFKELRQLVQQFASGVEECFASGQATVAKILLGIMSENPETCPTEEQWGELADACIRRNAIEGVMQCVEQMEHPNKQALVETAVVHGNIPILGYLLEAGDCSLLTCTPSGHTLISKAAKMNNLNMARYILSLHPDAVRDSPARDKVMGVAMFYSGVDMMQLLREHGAIQPENLGNHVFWTGNIDVINFICRDETLDVIEFHEELIQIIVQLVIEHHPELVEYLHEVRGVPLDAGVFFRAAEHGDVHTLRQYVEHAMPIAPGIMLMAAINGHADCVEYLYGVDPTLINAIDKSNINPPPDPQKAAAYKRIYDLIREDHMRMIAAEYRGFYNASPSEDEMITLEAQYGMSPIDSPSIPP